MSYSIWGERADAKLVGKHVQPSDRLFMNWFANEHPHIHYARLAGRLIGCAVILQVDVLVLLYSLDIIHVQQKIIRREGLFTALGV